MAGELQEKSQCIFSKHIFKLKNQKIYLHVSNGFACGVQNLKLRLDICICGMCEKRQKYALCMVKL
jgi:hypothetical protein